MALVQSLQIPVHKLLLIGTSAEIQKVKGYWEKQSLKTSALYLSKDNYLEVTHREVSKEKALMELAYYNVPLAQTLAIGDNFNDLPMILKAGVGVAMANAPRRVRNRRMPLHFQIKTVELQLLFRNLSYRSLPEGQQMVISGIA